MRSGLLFTLILCLGLPAWAASPEISQGNPSTANPSRYEVLAYQEDFESGAAGWTHYDGTISPNNWHVHDYDGTQGNVWWMGDPALASGDNIGGYYNHQYLVLDTPARIISTANATLTFKMRLGLEDPSPSGDYDGWDSANIRISTNGGSTWSVIMGIPAYHYNNSYAFGYEHGEGMGIPAWGGMVTNWTTATFDLAAYVGQSVKIRFAFASDPATSTVDQPNMFGFMVDDISFGGYTNNGVDDGQMTFSSLVPLGGDLWHLATEASAPSPSHVMKNQNAAGSYNNNMRNYLLSPSITLPASGAIRADFQIMGSFSGPGTFPDAEYWGWEISVDNGSTWNAMSNPYANPNGNNYVYSDVPTGWSSMTESFNLNGMISDFAGQSVKFRWFFSSNATAAQGSGIMIDDFKILNDIVLPAPTELTAIQIGTNVSLSWISPVDGVSGHNIYRDQIMISQVSNTTFNYVDMNVDAGMHSYYVTAMYGTNESMPSNSAQVTVLTPGYTELQYDDGSSEMGLNVGYSHQMAVYYNHGSELILKYAKVYLHNFSPSSLIVRAKDVGADGMPGDNLAQVQYPVSSQVQGWNYILFPEIEIPDGAFYLSILEIPNPSSIGLDTDNSGHSFVNMGSNAGWTAYTAGEIMIRAIVETSSNEITQNISLTGGWNLVSLNVSPSDHTLPTLLAPISSQIQQVKGTEGIYIPGNPYSTLSALTDGKAYNIQVNSNATCSITGTQIPFDTTLALSEGWNLTAYLPQNPMEVATAMQSISNWLQQVKGSDGVYIPGNPYSSLSTMYPGKGYWIQLTGAHDLIYPYGRAV
ncbi:MAG: immune inhibitor A, partial [Candidatus Cloacimonetes bacterium]|nr:immune inhibitor A [Candidatus Cloacimonadota bacterium]